VAGATGLEPTASRVTGRLSNQLNYAAAVNSENFPTFLRVPTSARPFPKSFSAVTESHEL
jgi:hypothetical protein